MSFISCFGDKVIFEELPKNDIKKRVIIQIDNPNQDFDELSNFFEQLGIQVDKEYGMISINPSLHRFVVRGIGDSTAIENVRQREGIKVFSDPNIDLHTDNGNTEPMGI